MKPSTVFEQHRETIRRLVHEHGMSNPRLFGSTLHGDDTEQSDLDILVDSGARTSLFEVARLEFALEDIIGLRIDVRLPGELHRGFREEVMAEASPI